MQKINNKTVQDFCRVATEFNNRVAQADEKIREINRYLNDIGLHMPVCVDLDSASVPDDPDGPTHYIDGTVFIDNWHYRWAWLDGVWQFVVERCHGRKGDEKLDDLMPLLDAPAQVRLFAVEYISVDAYVTIGREKLQCFLDHDTRTKIIVRDDDFENMVLNTPGKRLAAAQQLMKNRVTK
jgi:hypothetical protein